MIFSVYTGDDGICIVWSLSDLSLTSVDWTSTRSSATAEIARVSGHYAVQSHLRSLILEPVRSPYVTSYYWTTLTSYLPSFSSYCSELVELSFCLFLTHAFSVISANIDTSHMLTKTRFLDYISVTYYGSYFN